MKKILALATGCLLCIIFGCGTKDPQPSSKTKKQLLTDKAWQLASLEDKVNGVWVKDNNASSYEADNRFVFRADGTFEVNEGLTKRVPTDPQIVQIGTWTFLDNESKFQIDGGDLGNIIILSETTFQFTGPERYTFTHP